MATKVSDTQRLLQVLSDGQPHPHDQLYGLGMMVHSRIANLRARGYTIVCTRLAGKYWYTLTGSPDA